MSRRVRAWLELDRSDRGDLLVLLAALPLAAAVLRAFGLAASQRWLSRLYGSAARRNAGPEEFRAAQRLAELAAIAGRRGVIRASCLPQALVLHTLLRRRGLQALVKLGVRSHGGRVEAHAWVELDGITLGPAHEGYLAFEPRAPLTTA